MPSLGYAYEEPRAVASQTSEKKWPISLLMKGQPFRAIPTNYVDPALAPVTLDQDGVGACVAFAGEIIKNAQEFKDWGKHLFTTASAFVCYDWLKKGHGSFPGDGFSGEGSWPEALWKLGKAEGLPDGTGKAHKITAYYAANLGSWADWAEIQQIIMVLGAVNIATPWYQNWMSGPPGPSYIMPTPSGSPVGGHSYTLGGWVTINGTVYAVCFNSWGAGWTDKQGKFLVPVSWFFSSPLGPQVVWKTTDSIDAPIPPPPPPGGTMLVLFDKVPRTVDSAVGKQLFRADGTTPLTLLSSGVLNLASPAAYKNATGVLYYSIVITSGGIPQLAWIKATDCTNIRPVATDEKAAFNAGVTAASVAALTAKKP